MKNTGERARDETGATAEGSQKGVEIGEEAVEGDQGEERENEE